MLSRQWMYDVLVLIYNTISIQGNTLGRSKQLLGLNNKGKRLWHSMNSKQQRNLQHLHMHWTHLWSVSFLIGTWRRCYPTRKKWSNGAMSWWYTWYVSHTMSGLESSLSGKFLFVFRARGETERLPLLINCKEDSSTLWIFDILDTMWRLSCYKQLKLRVVHCSSHADVT